MKIYLIHHATAFSADEDPERHLTPLGRDQADRLGARLAAAGADPMRILATPSRDDSLDPCGLRGVVRRAA